MSGPHTAWMLIVLNSLPIYICLFANFGTLNCNVSAVHSSNNIREIGNRVEFQLDVSYFLWIGGKVNVLASR